MQKKKKKKKWDVESGRAQSDIDNLLKNKIAYELSFSYCLFICIWLIADNKQGTYLKVVKFFKSFFKGAKDSGTKSSVFASQYKYNLIFIQI